MALHSLPPEQLAGKINAQIQATPEGPLTPDLHTRHSKLTEEVGEELFKGKAAFHYLYRGYKHTPHSPPSMLLKYIAHRINHIHDYDDAGKGAELDQQFFQLHQSGKAREKNGHVTPADLIHWMRLNPHLPEHIARHALALQDLFKKGVGFNVKNINGYPHVAFNRELNVPFMANEHALTSFSSKTDSGFGAYKHYIWMPLKDLYYSFDLGPKQAALDEDGPEFEYVFTNANPRYQAQKDDVRGPETKARVIKSHYFLGHDPQRSDPSRIYVFDKASDGELATAIDNLPRHSIDDPKTGRMVDYDLLSHPNAGQLTWEAAKRFWGKSWGKTQANEVQNFRTMCKACPRAEAMAVLWNDPTSKTAGPKLAAIQNPNLTNEDLKAYFSVLTNDPKSNELLPDLVRNPSASKDLVKDIISKYPPRTPMWRKLLLSVEGDRLPPEVFDEACKADGLSPLDIHIVMENNPSLKKTSAKVALESVWKNRVGNQTTPFFMNQPVDGGWLYEQVKNTTQYDNYNHLSDYISKNPYITSEDIMRFAKPECSPQVHRALLNSKKPIPPAAFNGLVEKYMQATGWTDLYTTNLNLLAASPYITKEAAKRMMTRGKTDTYILASNPSVQPEWFAEQLPADLKPAADQYIHGAIDEPKFYNAIYPRSVQGNDSIDTLLYGINRALQLRLNRAESGLTPSHHIVKPLPPIYKSEQEGIGAWIKSQLADIISLEKAQESAAAMGSLIGPWQNGFVYDYSHLLPPELKDYRISLLDDGGPYNKDTLTPLPVWLGPMSVQMRHKSNDSGRPCASLEGDITGSSLGLQFKPKDVYTHPKHEGQGVGQVLLNAAKTHALYAHNAMLSGNVPMAKSEPLEKMHTLAGFPKLGINKRNTGTYIVTTQDQLKSRAKLAAMAEGIPEKEAKNAIGGAHGVTVTNPTHPSRMSYVNNAPWGTKGKQKYNYYDEKTKRMVEYEWDHDPKPPLDPYQVEAVVNHENIHQLFNQVDEKYGKTGRHFLALNLVNAIPVQYRNYLDEYMRYKNQHLDRGSQAEEKLTYLHDYLNNKSTRNSFHSGHTESYKTAFGLAMKRAHRSLLDASAVAAHEWTQGLVQQPGQFEDPDVKRPSPAYSYGNYHYGAPSYYNTGGGTSGVGGKWDQYWKDKDGGDNLEHWFDGPPSDKPPDRATLPFETDEFDGNELDRLRAKYEAEEEIGDDMWNSKLQDGRTAAEYEAMLNNHMPPVKPNTRDPKEFLNWKNDYLDWQERQDYIERAARYKLGVGEPPEMTGDLTIDQNETRLQEMAARVNNPMDREDAKRQAVIDSFTPDGLTQDPNHPTAHPNYDPNDPAWKAKVDAYEMDKLNARRFNDPVYLIGDETGINEHVDSVEDPYAEKPPNEIPTVKKKGKKLKKALPSNLADTPQEHDQVVEEMLGFVPTLHNMFEAARFLVNGPVISLDQMRRALWAEDGDMEKAALIAYGIEVSKSNLDALKAAANLIKLSKSDSQVHAQVIQPGVPDADNTAKEIEDAFKAGAVQRVALNGKYSRGALIARDPISDNVYLLKPDAKGQSPAKGANEEDASQPRREAAFWHCAELLGLGQFIPRADLVIIDENEWAAIKLLPYEYKNMEKRYRVDPSTVVNALNRYRDQGILHRWAVLDFILGNPDRHGQNMMIGEKKRMGRNVDDIALIDHGSAFAGQSFDPAHDQNSFIPFYLRANAGAFNKLPAKMKLGKMPSLQREAEDVFAEWVDHIDQHKLARILQRYGINPAPVIYRLGQLKMMPGTKFEAINKLWAGTSDEGNL